LEKMITKLKYGNTNTFFIRGAGGNILVDTDYAGTIQAFYREIKKHEIRLSDITYVLATHYHPDHVGLVSELVKRGVKLLLIDIQKPHVHYGDDIFAREKIQGYEPINENDAIVISCKDSRKFLGSIGIEGEIIATTSHSEDSISLILDNGVCIVGDLEPMGYLEAYEENENLKRDWDRILNYHPRIVYHAHANEKVI